MAELETNIPEFKVQVNLDGTVETILINPKETSDGIQYYSCIRNGKETTQIRTNEEGVWEQLWGQLPQKDIDAIGEAIKAHV